MLDSGKKKVDQLHSVISNKELALAHTTEIKNKKSRTGDLCGYLQYMSMHSFTDILHVQCI